LGCLRGVSTLTGFALAAEIGDWTRFTGASVGAFLGLVPSEHSSGASRRQGGIVKTGNQHARRLLIEAAWRHRPAYHPARSAVLRERWAKADPAVRRRGDQANRRLHRQWVKFDSRGKRPATANAAVARELAGFCWSLATMAT
jgi:transposase